MFWINLTSSLFTKKMGEIYLFKFWIKLAPLKLSSTNENEAYLQKYYIMVLPRQVKGPEALTIVLWFVSLNEMHFC